MQAHVDEIRRNDGPHGKVGRVREAARDARRAQALPDVVREPARVPQLEGVSDLTPPPEHAEEVVEALDVAGERRRELPHDDRELVAEAARLLSEPADRVTAIRQPLVVRYEAVTLHGKAEPRRCLRGPRGVAFARDLAVVRPIDLDGVEQARDVRQPLPHGHAAEHRLGPGPIAPAARADEDAPRPHAFSRCRGRATASRSRPRICKTS